MSFTKDTFYILQSTVLYNNVTKTNCMYVGRRMCTARANPFMVHLINDKRWRRFEGEKNIIIYVFRMKLRYLKIKNKN